MLRGCFSSHSTVRMQIIQGKTDKAVHWEVLEKNLYRKHLEAAIANKGFPNKY